MGEVLCFPPDQSREGLVDDTQDAPSGAGDKHEEEDEEAAVPPVDPPVAAAAAAELNDRDIIDDLAGLPGCALKKNVACEATNAR